MSHFAHDIALCCSVSLQEILSTFTAAVGIFEGEFEISACRTVAARSILWYAPNRELALTVVGDTGQSMDRLACCLMVARDAFWPIRNAAIVLQRSSCTVPYCRFYRRDNYLTVTP